MPNHPYPQPIPHEPGYSWNLGVCIICHHTWFYQHNHSDYMIITRICPTCIPKLAAGQAGRRSA